MDDKIVSTDNWRISQYEFPKPKANMDFLLPKASAKELVGHKVGQVQQGENWVHFRNRDGLVFSARTIAVDFPECDRFFKLKGETVELPVRHPAPLASLIRRAGAQARGAAAW